MLITTVAQNENECKWEWLDDEIGNGWVYNFEMERWQPEPLDVELIEVGDWVFMESTGLIGEVTGFRNDPYEMNDDLAELVAVVDFYNPDLESFNNDFFYQGTIYTYERQGE